MIENLTIAMPVIIVILLFLGKLVRKNAEIRSLEVRLEEERSRYKYKLHEFTMEMGLMRNELHSLKSGIPKLVTPTPPTLASLRGRSFTTVGGGMAIPPIDPIMLFSVDSPQTAAPPVDTSVVDWLEKK